MFSTVLLCEVILPCIHLRGEQIIPNSTTVTVVQFFVTWFNLLTSIFLCFLPKSK